MSFKPEMKSLIKFAMEKDISGLETKIGYNGAPILRISAKDSHELNLIRAWCNKLGFSSVIHSNEDTNIPIALRPELMYNLFCVFGADTADTDVYQLG